MSKSTLPGVLLTVNSILLLSISSITMLIAAGVVILNPVLFITKKVDATVKRLKPLDSLKVYVSTGLHIYLLCPGLDPEFVAMSTNGIQCGPLVNEAGSLLVHGGNKVLCFEESVNASWSAEFPGEILAMTLGLDGAIYITNTNGNVACFEMDLRSPRVVAGYEAVQNLREEAAFLRGKPTHDPEIDGNELSRIVHKQIPRMHVRMEKAIA